MARFERTDYRDSHRYTLDGLRIPGVTTVIGILDKPALVGWAARESAAYAIEHWDELSRLPLLQRAKEIEGARWKTNKAAVMRGNRLHEFGRKVASSGTAEVPAEWRSEAEAYARLLDSWQMEPVILESPICHTEYRYAGTLDGIMDSPRLGRVLLDLKTGSGVYEEVRLQLAAYRHADAYLIEVPQVGPRGGARPSLWQEAPMIAVDACYVAHIKPEVCELHPVEAGEHEFEMFLYLLELYEGWVSQVGWDFRDTDTYNPGVGKPIWPEDVPAGVDAAVAPY